MIPDIHISDYSYPLPDERIAKYPLAGRDASKLLVYRSGKITERVFRDIPDELPSGALMVFNNTKVVPARLNFVRGTGARIEIFCLEPHAPAEYSEAFSAVGECEWKAVIGNSKRWKGDILEYLIPPGSGFDGARALGLRAELVSRDGQTGIVRFRWQGSEPFSNVLDICGKVPIPPYLNRDSEEIDTERYQTLYARYRGSVAAPTAGLHFTEAVLEKIKDKSIDTENVCLHVGAGTFLPVKSETISEHPMHREPFTVSRGLLVKLRDAVRSGRPVIAVGTTSMRTLESLYHEGVGIIGNGVPSEVEQWAPYDERALWPSSADALDAIIGYMDREGLAEFGASTRIIIVPGYRFRIVDILSTNFHQPESTLILLVAAFVGKDWRRIYDHALASDFRFLSYGDSSLLFRA
ncbi:MAG: S-adenosylmethionine:tRNA ribosyltransferase-isomerase [Bacteroidales bacterium]|nr:S-adenosylmethionine:tRNA ribosyltransferase-isomerase [Bacteroidales bacterium]